AVPPRLRRGLAWEQVREDSASSELRRRRNLAALAARLDLEPAQPAKVPVQPRKQRWLWRRDLAYQALTFFSDPHPGRTRFCLRHLPQAAYHATPCRQRTLPC